MIENFFILPKFTSNCFSEKLDLFGLTSHKGKLNLQTKYFSYLNMYKPIGYTEKTTHGLIHTSNALLGLERQKKTELKELCSL